MSAAIYAPHDAELADVLAYLRRRQGNARTVAAASPTHDELHHLAHDRARQLAVVIDDLAQHLHRGCAATEAQLAQAGKD